ncbi:hypothetical protein [Burkholderia territorii]|uniref:Uncharacterized protein n=1 Tax=Burkholderia territorii TaxID=1503055 RepID=A0A6L3NL29_9BURK|nr:hypothetical protein [Burkholderia territorii]KAB0685284.1 hypothetical protein F7R13_05155 [Burkholderia territorii]MBM2774418.1 hypothetical protein [Burkholderia territorii]
MKKNQTNRKSAFFLDGTPKSVIGVLIALFSAWCLIFFGIFRDILYTIDHPTLTIHGKIESHSLIAASTIFLSLFPVIGAALIFNLYHQKKWAMKWTLGLLSVDLFFRLLSIFTHTVQFRFGIVDSLFIAALALLLTPESKRWFKQKNPV